MVAENAFKALEKRKGTYAGVHTWMHFKTKQRAELKGVVQVDETWVPSKDEEWGQDLHVTTYAPLDAKSTKGMAICFHGLGNYGEREYYYLAPWLAKHGIVAVAPDLPYFGHNVLHRGAHGRIGKWSSQIKAMTKCVKWAFSTASPLASAGIIASELPWFVVGISMSGLGVLDWGLTQFNEVCLDPKDMARCRGIVSLVPAVKFTLDISPVKKLLALIIGNLAPNFVFDQQTAPDPATGLAPVSHDKQSVQWCIPCIEPASSFDLAHVCPHCKKPYADTDETCKYCGEPDIQNKEYQIDCFPGSPLSTVIKLYFASGRVYKSANKWPKVPLFCTGSSMDDLVDPTGAAEFVAGIDQTIPHQYKLYDGWYHAQTGEQGKEMLFDDILSFIGLS
jgi:alpha-beta hydrolase superfamily lysophospholipase